MLIKNANAIFIDQIGRADIRVQGDKITEISTALSPQIGESVYDFKDYYLTAGFIDIHTHGGYGCDFMDATQKAFDTALDFHLDNGTTAVLPTSCSAKVENILEFINFSRKYKRLNKKGKPKVLGLHLEGPFLSEKNRGAQKLEDLQSPKTSDYCYILDNADIIKSVTLSPELDGASEMCRKLKQSGILVCGGHDDGIYPEFMPSIQNGLSHATHLYCAMSDLRFKNGRREVGFREYVLTDDNITAEIIADNRHIPPLLAKMIYRAKGADRLCVVSDSLRCAGEKENEKIFTLGSGADAQRVKVQDGVAVLENGITYAGSITPVREMVKNLIDIGIPIVDAVKMGTTTPAKIVKESSIGEIAVGKTADICILNKNFGVEKVMINGSFRKGE